MSIPNETQKHKNCSVKLYPIDIHKLFDTEQFYSKGNKYNINKKENQRGKMEENANLYEEAVNDQVSNNVCFISILMQVH